MIMINTAKATLKSLDPLHNPLHFLNKGGQATALPVNFILLVDEQVGEDEVGGELVDGGFILVEDPFCDQEVGLAVEDRG